MRGHPCITTMHHPVGIGICTLNYLCHWATLYLTYHGAQQVATGLVYDLVFTFQSRPSLELIHRSNGDNDTMQALPSGLSCVLTQHGSGLILHSTSPLNPSRSCMNCSAWMPAALQCIQLGFDAECEWVHLADISFQRKLPRAIRAITQTHIDPSSPFFCWLIMGEDGGHRLFYAKAQCQVWLRAKQPEYIMQRDPHASYAWVQLNTGSKS